MFEQVLWEIRSKVRSGDYVVTIHADEEMDDDQLAIGDVEACIASGGGYGTSAGSGDGGK